MTESATRKSLDKLPVAGEASGHGDGDGASTIARARGSQEKREWERGILRARVCLQRRGDLILLDVSWMLDTS